MLLKGEALGECGVSVSITAVTLPIGQSPFSSLTSDGKHRKGLIQDLGLSGSNGITASVIGGGG